MASAPNTPVMPYLDTENKTKVCDKDKKRVEKHCAPATENKDRRKNVPKAQLDKKNGKEADWVLDYCGPLLMMPGRQNFEEWYAQFQEVGKLMDDVADRLKGKVTKELEEEIAKYAAKAGGKMLLRRGLTGWIPIVGWIMTGVDVVLTAVEVASKVSEMRETLKDLKETAEALKREADRVTSLFNNNKEKMKNFSKLSEDEQKAIVHKVMTGVQTAYATANPCLRARKCSLVAFNKDGVAKWRGTGCCPGQSGHHLIPDTMFRDPAKADQAREAWKKDPATKGKKMPRDKLPTLACWGNYSEGAAPTICAEGTNQYAGSHGVLHRATDVALRTSKVAEKSAISYAKARDLVLNEITETYGCNKQCLQEQLDAYYCKKVTDPCSGCKDATVVPNSGIGGSQEGDNETNNEQ